MPIGARSRARHIHEAVPPVRPNRALGRNDGRIQAEAGRKARRALGEAARDTGKLIDRAIERSAHSSGIAGGVATSLETILGGARRVDTLLGEISEASAEQDTGAQGLYRSIEEMNTVTASNAEGAHRLSSAARETSDHAEHLKGLVARFELVPGDSDGSALITL